MAELNITFADQPKPDDQGLQIDFLDQPKARTAQGIGDAWTAGYQGSVAGLGDRGRMPDVVLDPNHAKWYEKLTAGVSQLVNEAPEMIGGAIVGGAAGTLAGGPVGTVLGGGAGAFAIPTAIRQSLIEAYSKGQVTSAGDFLGRAAIVLKHTAKDAVVGGLTTGSGMVASRVAGGLIAPMIGEQIGVKTGMAAIGAAGTAAEIGTMTVAPAALESRLPERDDFLNAAIMVAGLKSAHIAASKMGEIYAKTGIRPEQVVADAKADPALAAELSNADVFYHGSKAKFDTFDPTLGTTPGAWFTKDKNAASAFGDTKAYTIEVKNPATMADLAEARIEIVKSGIDPMADQQEFNKAVIKYLEKKGFDGIQDENFAGAGGKGKDVIAAFRPEQIKPVTELPEAYKAVAAEQNAMDAVTGVKLEAVKDQPFADVPQAAGEPAQPTHVNYQYINTTDDVKGALARLSNVYETEIQTQRRGTVTWDQTQAEAGAILSDLLGTTQPFVPREPGTAAGAAELLARKQMVVGAAEDMATKAREYADLGSNATPEQTAAFLSSIDRAAMIHSEFLGARAEAGRALNILKDTKIAAERSQQISELIARFGKDPAELAAMIKELDNPASTLKFARDATKASTWDKVVEAWKAALVSGPITQMANIYGNVTFMPLRPLVDLVASGLGAIRGNSERVTAIEPFARITGNLIGVVDGLKMAWPALIKDSPENGKADHRHAIGGTLGYVVRTPFRVLGAGDALFKGMTYRGDLYAQATRMATSEGFNVATREFRERVVELVRDPTSDMLDVATASAARFTFNSPLGETGRAVQNLVRKAHLEFLVPFITTPANVFKETARLTPFAPIVDNWRKDFAAGGAQADRAVAELAVGAGIMSVTASFALAGFISGAGDPDPNKRRVMMAAGWQPYSVKVDGKWYSYQRVQPTGTLMGVTADMVEMWHHMTSGESDKIPKMLSVAFANAVTNTTFLKGITSFVQVMADPTRYGGKFVQDLASSVVPGIVGQTATAYDPYVREIDSVRDAIMNRIPGLREELTPARDVFGEKVANKERLGGAISPVSKTTESTDKVRTEAARLGIGAPKAPDSVQMPAAGDRKLGKVDLSPAQKDVFADVGGHMAYQALHSLVNSPQWDAYPDMVKQKAYQIAFDRGHLIGKNAALSPEDRQREIVRITTEIAKRLAK